MARVRDGYDVVRCNHAPSYVREWTHIYNVISESVGKEGNKILKVNINHQDKLICP